MNTSDIRPLQLHILKILQAIDKVCRERGLRYYLWAGTMLGAVRHKGFIPWDDDIDISMPRPDYELLVEHCHEWLPQPFEMICSDLKDDYSGAFAKIVDSSTTLIEREFCLGVGGLYVDVFPIDGVPQNKIGMHWVMFKYMFYKKVTYYLDRDPFKHGYGPRCWIPLLCRALFNKHHTFEKVKKMQKRYDYESSRFVADYDDGLRGILDKTVLGKPTPVVFEGTELFGVEHYDEYLTKKYGSYMVIPNDDQKRQHNFFYVNYNLPYHKYHRGKKNIYIESYAISNPYVGLGEFCMNLCSHLAKHAKDLKENYGIELYYIVPRGCAGVYGDDVHYISFPHNMKFFSKMFFHQMDLLHFTHQYCRFKHFPNVKESLLTIHDINFYYEKHGAKLEKYKTRFNKKVEKANYINYISHFTQKDTEEHFNIVQPSRVIYNGVSKLQDTLPEVSEEFVEKIPKTPYLFHISSLRPKKNVHLLVEMMVYLPNEYLVICGDWKTEYGQQMRSRINELNLRNVTCLDNVSNDEKAWLYKNCKAFLFPSLCEGFGLPPIEAMCYGKPIFLSTLTSLPEIGGDYSFYWNELVPEKMAEVFREKMTVYATHPEWADMLRKNTDRFDWDKCANEYINFYLDILQIAK